MVQPEGSRNPVVLLLDDDYGLRRSLARILEVEGYRVFEASDGGQARMIADQEDHIDLLVADLVLPGVGGREVAAVIQAHQPGMKVVFTSGFVASDPVLKELRAAGYTVVRKPYQVPDFLEAVRRTLAE